MKDTIRILNSLLRITMGKKRGLKERRDVLYTVSHQGDLFTPCFDIGVLANYAIDLGYN